jgi:hypothetical protein
MGLRRIWQSAFGLGHRLVVGACLAMACGPNVRVLDPTVQGDCRAACAKLASLGCQEGQDVECVPFCEASQASGGAVSLLVGCVEKAESKVEVRQCRVECQ